MRPNICFIAICLLASARAYADEPAAPQPIVKLIATYGCRSVSPQSVVDASGVHIGDNLSESDSEEIRERLEKFLRSVAPTSPASTANSSNRANRGWCSTWASKNKTPRTSSLPNRPKATSHCQRK